MQETNEQVEIIREAFRYTQAFREKTFVLQIDDTVVDDAILPALVRDLVLLQRTGIRIALVAGARQRIDEILQRYGVDCEKRRGIRISTPEAIPFIKMAAFDIANRIMTSLSGFGVNAVIGNWVRSRSLGVVDGVDFQDAGTVAGIRADLLGGVISQGSIPILPCIGWNSAGKPYNLSSRELAASLAISLKASKLFFVSAYDGLQTSGYTTDETISSAPGGRISRMSIDQAKRFVDLNPLEDDLGVELVSLALKAARDGVERVHLVDGRTDGAVLREIFSNLGVGTMIHTNKYQSIRGMERDDVPDVHRLMRPLIERGLLVPRSEIDLADLHHDFVVFETDGMVHGCGALHRYGEDQAEIAGLAVDSLYDHLGIGQRIVSYLIERARTEGVGRVFALTTQASDWFEQLGFQPGTVADVPDRKQSAYDHTRKSRILIFDL
jgi:amino-acid N-acetyltransferase